MTNILDKIMHNGTEYDLPEGIPSGGTDGQFLGKVSGDTAWADAPVTSVNSKTGVVTLDADDISDSTTTNKFVTASDKSTWSGKQDALVSGTNIKTINNTSLLGSGDLTISGGITNDTTGTTSTVTGIWAGTEAEYGNITPSGTVLYFTF